MRLPPFGVVRYDYVALGVVVLLGEKLEIDFHEESFRVTPKHRLK